MTGDDLARRQAALVAALVSGAQTPSGFDETRVRAAAFALVRKRAAEVTKAWPMLRASLGPQWGPEFAAWAAGRPPRGSLRDGWDFARHIAAHVGLDATARQELAEHEIRWRYDGIGPPRRRRLPHARRTPSGFAIQVFGKIRRYEPRAH